VNEIVQIPIVDLQFDATNPRLGKESYSSQQNVALGLAEHQGKRLLRLAEHIVENGLDPTTLMAVVPTSDRRRRYTVIEGNRRLLAIKALETPALVNPVLTPSEQRKLVKLSERYADEPIDTINCVLFDDEDEAQIWIRTRHTGANEGAGLVEWNSDEKDRYEARHGRRGAAGQIIDFIDKVTGGSDSKAKIITNVGRVTKTKVGQEVLGIEVVNGKVRSRYPVNEVAKGLSRLVNDLRAGAITSRDIYTAEDIADYLAKYRPAEKPNPKKALPEPVELDDLAAGITTPAPPKPARRPKKGTGGRGRTVLIPSTCTLNINPPRINAIYVELSRLDVDDFPNAGSVLLRVFLELSVDHYIETEKVKLAKAARDTPLAKRLKEVAAHLHNRGAIPEKLLRAIEKVANNRDVISASTVTFNQYVHNEYVHPKPSELRTAWDELQPFMEKLWP
jgi:hypothetical protein